MNGDKSFVLLIKLEFASMAESANIDLLPNEILRKIVNLAASEVTDEDTGKTRIDHKFLMDVISQVCIRFKYITIDR